MEECDVTLRTQAQQGGCTCDSASHGGFRLGDNNDDPPYHKSFFHRRVRSTVAWRADMEAAVRALKLQVAVGEMVPVDWTRMPPSGGGRWRGYFANCDCDYCRRARAGAAGDLERCLCCDAQVPPDLVEWCTECNCVLCDRCCVRGRYYDTKFCFCCRRFGFEKNVQFFFPRFEKMSPEEDWMAAAWYY
jgi:hypothetical protein